MSNSSFTVQLSTTDQNDIFLDFGPGNWSLDLRSVSWLSVTPSIRICMCIGRTSKFCFPVVQVNVPDFFPTIPHDVISGNFPTTPYPPTFILIFSKLSLRNHTIDRFFLRTPLSNVYVLQCMHRNSYVPL